MELLRNVEQYKELKTRVKNNADSIISNLYFYSEELLRYIELERVYFEVSDFGLVLFFDDDLYYKVYIYADPDKASLNLPQQKDLLFRNIYRKSNESKSQESVEIFLNKLGFEKKSTTVEIQGKPTEIIQKLAMIERYSEKFEKKGYKCIVPEKKQISEIEQLILESQILKKYHIEFRTDEEKDKLLRGSYLCIIKGNEICAASIATINHDVAHVEDIVIKEKYKMTGLAPLLTYYRMKWLCENNVRIAQGWILTENEKSIRYHESLGYKFTNKFCDEWILVPKELRQ